MALKNLFDMVKADRYTQDGREAIIKAQEEETEDKVYQIGEISQKTGLQKTANGWVKPKSGKVPGAKTGEGKSPNAAGSKPEGMPGRDYPSLKKEDHVKLAKEVLSNTSATDPGWTAEEIAKEWKLGKADAEEVKKEFDNLRKGSSGNKPAESKPAAPRREAVSAGRMMKDLDGNFWSRPEDFKDDITSRGWDVDEMTNEYAVISNEAGSQYEVRFDDHRDDGDLTVRNFKALQIDEDDDDDSLEDAAPSLSEIVDRVYNIGEISEKTGLQKTAQGWRPPQETKFGKVKQNKEGQWGVQVKQGKGSDFLKHKSEAEAKRALSNYTAGYNTTARSKEDPHSDKARQVKQWRKEDEKAAKARRAEGRAAHAAQFQKPTAGNNLPDIPDFKGMESGDYDNKLRAEGWTTGGWEGNGTHASAIFKKGDRTIRVNEGQPGKITSVQEISKPAAESKPDAVDQRDQIGGEIKGNLEAAKYYFDKAQSFSLTDPSFKTYMAKAKEYNDKAKAQADDNGFDWEEMHNRGITRAVDEFARQNKSKATDAYSWIKREAGDSAPRVLTGDTRIRVRKA